MNHLLTLLPNLLAATSKKTSSSGSVTFLLFIVIVVAALYFLFLRPNQQKARRQREENSSIAVGDRVVSIGGIVGTIESMHNDRVVLVTGHPGLEGDGHGLAPTHLVLLRSAIARKVDAGTPASTVVDAPGATEVDEHLAENGHGTTVRDTEPAEGDGTE